MSLASNSSYDIPKPSHVVAISASTRLYAYSSSEVGGFADAILDRAACRACEEDGVHAADRSAPHDCYCCGKKARPLAPNQDTSESEG
jgi:hypothetical protein